MVAARLRFLSCEEYSMNLKLFGKNTVIYAIGNVGLRAASFFLIPLYTYSLSVSDYGLLATLLITIQIMVIFMGMGMRTSLVRFTREYEDKNQIKELLGTTTFINFAGGLTVTSISILFLLPFFRSVLHTDNVYKYVMLTCCAALSQSLSIHIMSYYRARNEAVKFMVIGISAAVILFLANFILIYVFKLGIIGALSAYITAYTAIFLFVSFDVLLKTGIGISLILMPKLLRFGSPLIFSMSGQFVMGGASIFFLSYFLGLEVVAIYSLGYKLAQVLVIAIILPFQLAFQPFVFTNLNSPDIKEKISRLLTYLVLAITLMSFIILLSLRILLPIIAPPEYSSAYLVILLLLPGMAFIGIYYFGETLLNAVQKTYIIGFTMTIFAIISIILNCMLIPVMNWYGAAIALNVSYILVGFTLLMIGLRKFPVPIEWRRISSVGVLFVSSLIIVFLLYNTNILFYTTLIGFAFIILLFIFSFSFFNEQEKLFLRNATAKFKSTILT